ncbi:MAG: SDR family NAD(P)-dependent oxidoreductase, partial [Vicinamibacterales bacterium]
MSIAERRVALVTGANRGLGFETSRQLLARGLTVVLAGRDPRAGARWERLSGFGSAGPVGPASRRWPGRSSVNARTVVVDDLPPTRQT